MRSFRYRLEKMSLAGVKQTGKRKGLLMTTLLKY